MRIKFNNLIKKYESLHAVNDITLEIPEGKICGIIGKSGAGKSTILRMISLLERPESGEIYYSDKRVDNLCGKELIQMRRKLGMIFQNFNLFSSRNVLENVIYPLEIARKDLSKAQMKQRGRELLNLVGLSERENEGISKLSGGQKQRVAIARALANNPEVLFCDEATSALDPETTSQILSLIKNIQKELSLTVVMVTHQMEVVRDSCDYVAVIDKGKLAEYGCVSDVFSSPKSDIAKNLLASLNTESSRLVSWAEGGRYTLRFPAERTTSPIITSLARKYNVDFDIYAAGTQVLENGAYGTMLVDILGGKEDVVKTIQELKDNNIIVEEANK